MGNSHSGGRHDTSTPHHPPGVYTKRAGSADQDGTDFEIKMCALIFLRAVQSFSSFRVWSNYTPAGDFDDIVISYGSPEKEQNILVQLKSTTKRTINISPTGKYPLKNYFKSLKNSKTSEFLKNCSYVIFTNAHVNLKPSVLNVHSAARNLLCTTWKPDDVCQVHLTDNICKGFKRDIGAEDFVNRLLIFRNQSGPKYLDEFIMQELIKMCNGFEPQCRTIQQIFVEKIKAWWGEESKAPLDENWKEWTVLKAQLLEQNTLLKMITFREDTLAHLEGEVFGSASDIILLKYDSAEVKMACSKVYQSFIRMEHQVLFTDISEPQSSLNKLYSLWERDVCKVLVITDVTNCAHNVGGNIANYNGNPKNRNQKKIVIISNTDAKTLGIKQGFVHEIGTESIKSTFNQLDDNSRDLLKNLSVDFQGKRTTLGSIKADKLLEGGLLQCVLTSPKIQIGERLPASNDKYIPRTLSKRFVVNRSILNSKDAFVLCGVEENDLKLLIAEARGEVNLDEQWFSEQKHRFNITSRKELDGRISGLKCSNEKLYRFHIKSRKVLDETISELKCCVENLSEGPVHFLEVIDGSLHWMHSHGSTDNLFKHIERCPREDDDCKKLIRELGIWRVKEEDLVRKEFQTVIVADEPGSGKTALLREVAYKMKELYPHRWIIYTDLNKHSEILKEIEQLGNVTRESVLHLLCKAANVDDSELGKQLLKYSVLESGDVCILFDAFDEIVPSYTDTFLDILQLTLRDLRVSTLWVASRYNVKDKLQNVLECKVFRIEPLSDDEQFLFFSKLWGEEKATRFQDRFPWDIPVRDGVRLTSFPLPLQMVCEVCHDLVMSDNFLELSPPVFTMSNLYEKFIELKLSIYFKEKAPLNDPSAQIDIIKEKLREHFMESHMICSLVVLDILKFLDESDQSSIMKKVERLCQDIKEGKENFGMIDGVVDGKPHFLHRTLAEYFAGKWLAKHWKKNVHLIRKITFDHQSVIIYQAMCQELASGLPAHLAVLNGDLNALTRLKDDLHKTDVLGRTPLHLAAQGLRSQSIEMVSELMKYKPNLEITDYLHDYTALYYAVHGSSWFTTLILLLFGARVTRRNGYLENVIKDMEGDGTPCYCMFMRNKVNLLEIPHVKGCISLEYFGDAAAH